MSKTKLKLKINGKTKEVTGPLDLAALLSLLELPGDGQGIAVEHNREIVAKKDYVQTKLLDGDQLEIVTLVGGG